MKILLIGVEPYSITNFRGSLIKSMINAGHEVVAAGYKTTEFQRKNIESLGCIYKEYPVQRTGFNPALEFITLFSLIKMFFIERPDIVIGYTSKPVIWSGFAKKIFPNIKFFALITGLGYAFGEGSFLRKLIKFFIVKLYRISLSGAKGVIFQNDDNKRLFLSMQIIKDSKNIHVVRGSGIDLESFLYEPLNNTNIEFDFLMISRLLKDKGVREYIEAMEIVKKKYPNVRFALVGPEDESPNAMKIDNVLNDKTLHLFKYYGWLDDVRPMLKKSAVFVLPSYHEGLPRSVLEAMAIGRPILTTNVPGCRETVIDGFNGWLVSKKDSIELAKKMMWFLENQDNLSEMGKNSRKYAEENFDVKLINKSLFKHILKD